MPTHDGDLVRDYHGRRWNRRFHFDDGSPSLTRQEFADDCDINRILAQFQKTGAMSHFAKYGPMYGDFSALDYQSAQNLIIRARQMFDDLPSAIRNLVATPAGFLDWVQDPKNAQTLVEMGLARSPSSPNPSDSVPGSGDTPPATGGG